MRSFLSIAAVVFFSAMAAAEEGFTPLFNGKDLSGWQSARENHEAGSGKFSVDQAEGAIRVYAGDEPGSKQPIDCLYTEEEYSHYVLKLEYRWMENRFAPRAERDRDAGVLFHIHGDLTRIWPNCLELQLGDSDPAKTKRRYTTGDVWVIGEDVQVMNARDGLFYVPDAPLVAIGEGKVYDKSFTSMQREKPHGEWNAITLTVHGAREAVFELNGAVVNRISQATHEVGGQSVPLAKGRIGLEADYADLMYRNIRIKKLPVEREPAERASADVDGD